ncbi:MAG TPA: BadF/BadG/BcrA/BcrD ATPase family protein [bacterium]|nr:BadF/BadG/BcrA/BcrD ATPase family protein [bacterium]
MTRTLFIGIDGGMSKTEAAVINEDGALMAFTRGPGSAIMGIPSKNACGSLIKNATEACRQAGVSIEDAAAWGIGLSGIDFPDEFDRQHAALSEGLGIPPGRLKLANDAIAALWGATNARAAAIIQHGSAFTAAFRGEPGSETLFDHLDVGGIFDIRQELVKAVGRMIDGRLPKTGLLDAALKHYGIELPDSYAEKIFRRRINIQLLLSTPPLIFDAWRQGDPAAAMLVERAADDYVTAAAAMIERTQADDAAVCFGGGVIGEGGEALQSVLADKLRVACSAARVEPPRLRPALGAALMAAHAHGLDPSVLFDALAKEKMP